jgi:gliding motility-associated-like protein
VIEKDNIEELFSKAFENQTAPVKPEVWAGVQAKMAAAGVASVAASKGISVLTKWIIGTAAIGTAGVVTTAVLLSNNNQQENPQPEIVRNTPIAQHPTNLPEKQADKNAVDWSKVKDNQVHLDDLNLDFLKDTSLFKPFCLVKQSVLEINTWKDSAEVMKVPVVVEIPTVSNPSPIVNPIPETKKFPENTNEPAHAVLESKVTSFPNFFSPNGDNDNDSYFIELKNKEEIVDFKVQVFNQENKLVFVSTDPSFVWNGEDIRSNETIKDGMYFCLVTVKDKSGNAYNDKQLIEVKTKR